MVSAALHAVPAMLPNAVLMKRKKYRQRYHCSDCEREFDDLTGTIFAGHHQPLPRLRMTIQGDDVPDSLKGAVAAVMSSPIVALFFAYAFRIPIPLACYIGPFGKMNSYSMPISEVLMSVSIAWILYMMLGGFIVLPLCGAIAGTVAGRQYSNSKHKNASIVVWSIAAGALPVFVLSILDLIIGPW